MRVLYLALFFTSVIACTKGLPGGNGGGQPSADMQSPNNMQPPDLAANGMTPSDLAGPTTPLDLTSPAGDLAGFDCLGHVCKSSEICLVSTQGIFPGCVPLPAACLTDRTCTCIDTQSMPGMVLYSLCHANPSCSISNGGAQVFCSSEA